MIRKSLPHFLIAGCAVLVVATSAAAQHNSCCPPTVAYSPVPVQTFQPVVVQERRSWCCLGWLCDWMWGRNHTTVAAVPTAVPQTYAYAPAATCPPVACDPCAACNSNPCCCPSAGAAVPAGTPSTFAPAYSGSRTYQYGGETYARYAPTPVPQSTYKVANSIQGAAAEPRVLNASQVQLTSYQVSSGAVQPAAYQVPVAPANAHMAAPLQNATWYSVPPSQTTLSRLRVQ